jgi:hypothetical protein
MPPYAELFPVGTRVRIVDQASLEEFRRAWHYHHPLANDQMTMAGRVAEVEAVGFYHGGDPLYRLHGIRGQWHECCLEAADSQRGP